MQAAPRPGRLGSWFRRARQPARPQSQPAGRPHAAPTTTLPDKNSLMEGLTKHAGPVWLVSPDLRTITANPAAQAHIDAHVAQMSPDRRQNVSHRLSRAYRRALLSALRLATASDGTVIPGRANAALPQRLTCSVDGHSLELLFLEVRGVSSPEDARPLARPDTRTVAYLLVA